MRNLEPGFGEKHQKAGWFSSHLRIPGTRKRATEGSDRDTRRQASLTAAWEFTLRIHKIPVSQALLFILMLKSVRFRKAERSSKNGRVGLQVRVFKI